MWSRERVRRAEGGQADTDRLVDTPAVHVFFLHSYGGSVPPFHNIIPERQLAIWSTQLIPSNIQAQYLAELLSPSNRTKQH
jgi:hypothetical protein